MIYDLCVIGGGPAGYRAAQLAAGAGLKTLLFEKNALGGVCLNEGCIPSKALLYSAKLYNFAKGGAAPYGVSCQNPVLDYAAAVRRKDKIIRKLTAGVELALKSSGVEIVREDAVIHGRDGDDFLVNGYRSLNLLVCTGSEHILPPIDGVESAMTVREALSLTEIPETLSIVGGGAAGLEMASLFNSAGSDVTVYDIAHKIAGNFDGELSAMLQRVYEKKGVMFRLGGAVCGLSAPALICAGRRPVIPEGLDKIGVIVDRSAVVTDRRMKTNIPGVYAAGDVNGRSMLAHTAYREAEVAVNTVLGIGDAMDYGAVPFVIYTNPEAAGIGETLESAAEKGHDARETKLPMTYSGRFVAENERGEGSCKLVWSGKRLIGAHLLGNPASEIIGTLAAALYAEMEIGDIQKLILPHPSVGEIIKEAAYFG
jgi:dihydrolipoamide dehydrogenase